MPIIKDSNFQNSNINTLSVNNVNANDIKSNSITNVVERPKSFYEEQSTITEDMLGSTFYYDTAFVINGTFDSTSIINKYNLKLGDSIITNIINNTGGSITINFTESGIGGAPPTSLADGKSMKYYLTMYASGYLLQYFFINS